MLSIWNPAFNNHLTTKKGSRTIFNSLFSDPFESFMTETSRFGLEYKKDEDGSLSVSVDVPGIEEKDIAVEITETNVLSVRGERKTKTSSYNVHKSFYIPEDYNTSAIKAELKNGVLTISIPEKEQNSKETIKVPVSAVK